jgi:hypothetical protein
LAHEFHERRRRPVHDSSPECAIFVGPKHAEGGLAEASRPIQHRVEDRGEVAGRGIDDLQYLGGRRLLVQGLARLGQEPRILDRDDRLRREVLEEQDFFF